MKTWDEVYQFPNDNIEKYTAEVLKFLDIKFNPPDEKLLDRSKEIEWSKWGVRSGLNISEMCLDRWIGTKIENQPAMSWKGEEGEVREISYEEIGNIKI